MGKIFALITIFMSSLVLTVRCSRNDFPEGFVFGAGSSAYQWEGAVAEDGRLPSIWDTFCHSNSRNISSGDIACDGYHKYKEDVQLMVETGLDAFRFSISWSRLIPNGRGPVNQKGLQFYKNFIQQLIINGIEPHVTLFHCDHPQKLEDEYGGWLNRRMIKDFTAYADVCFKEFGNHVKFWTTINEANIFSLGGYTDGITPPGRCSNCFAGNSSTETYIVAHNLLLAHASVSTLYRNNYKKMHGGFVGLSIYTIGMKPSTNSNEDDIAMQRAMDFYMGWILEPLTNGDYPDEMKTSVGSRMPIFSEEESELVKGSSDFIGVIHYLATSVSSNKLNPSLSGTPPDFYSDMAVSMKSVGKLSAMDYGVSPWALENVLDYIKQRYDNPPVYIHENGIPTSMKQDLGKDTARIEYLQAYIGGVLNAVRNGSDTRGYFVWSLMDLYEIFTQYESGFGLYSVDFSDPQLKRSPKLSALWYSDFLKGKTTFLGSPYNLSSSS